MGKDKFYFIVDDTGFNKDKVSSEYLKGEKATFCGVILHKDNVFAAEKILKEFGKKLEKMFKTTEFHFTEMYNKNDDFKNLETTEFLEIIDAFVDLIYELGIDVVLQTIGETTYLDHPNLNADLKNKFLKPMQMTQTDKSNCLVLSVLRAKKYIEDELGGELIEVVCDEGIRKPNTEVKMPTNKAGEQPIKIKFKNSKEYSLLQLADFVAWAISREKQILQKTSKQRTDLDNEMLIILSDLMQVYVTATQANTFFIDDKTDSVLPYDAVIDLFREDNGI